MSMYNLDLLPNDDIAQDGKCREDSWKCRFSIHDQERDMIDLESIGEIVNTCPALVDVCDDHDFVASVYELCGQLIDMALDSSWLGKEEVTDHCDVVRHPGGGTGGCVSDFCMVRSRAALFKRCCVPLSLRERCTSSDAS